MKHGRLNLRNNQMNPFKLLKKKRFMAGLAKNAGSANVMIENQAGQLLVVKSGYKPYWSLPGGWIDEGESPRQAAIRELQEEISYSINQSEIDLVRVIHRKSAAAITHQFVFALNHLISVDTNFQLQASEIDDCQWVSRQDIMERTNGRSYNQSIKCWAEDSQATYLEISM